MRRASDEPETPPDGSCNATSPFDGHHHALARRGRLVCGRGARPCRLSAEKQFAGRLSAALIAAMPAAPADMGLPAAPRATVGSACKETPTGELEVTASASYRFRMPRAQAEQVAAQGRELQARLDALKALPPEAKGEFDALEARRQEAFRDARRADKEGNKPLASQKYKEAMAIESQRDALRKRHLDGVRAQTDPLEAQIRGLPRTNGEFEVVLQANRFEARPRDHELDLKLGSFASHGKPFAVRSLQATNAHATFCGHVHEARLYHLASTGKAADFVPTPAGLTPLRSPPTMARFTPSFGYAVVLGPASGPKTASTWVSLSHSSTSGAPSAMRT